MITGNTFDDNWKEKIVRKSPPSADFSLFSASRPPHQRRCPPPIPAPNHPTLPLASATTVSPPACPSEVTKLGQTLWHFVPSTATTFSKKIVGRCIPPVPPTHRLPASSDPPTPRNSQDTSPQPRSFPRDVTPTGVRFPVLLVFRKQSR